MRQVEFTSNTRAARIGARISMPREPFDLLKTIKVTAMTMTTVASTRRWPEYDISRIANKHATAAHSPRIPLNAKYPGYPTIVSSIMIGFWFATTIMLSTQANPKDKRNSARNTSTDRPASMTGNTTDISTAACSTNLCTVNSGLKAHRPLDSGKPQIRHEAYDVGRKLKSGQIQGDHADGDEGPEAGQKTLLIGFGVIRFCRTD